MGHDVVITGTGAICALGDSPAGIHRALCEGRTSFGAPTTFDEAVATGYEVAEVRDFAPQSYLGARNLRPLDRTGRLVAVGVQLVLASSGWELEAREAQGLGLVLGTMFCSVKTIAEFDRRAQNAGPEYASPLDFSNTVLNAAAGQVAIWHHLRGVNSTIAAGAVSGLQAIGYAAQLVRVGRSAALVAGGAEEVCFESFHGFRQGGALCPPEGDRPGRPRPFAPNRSGIALGEGAAFLVLEAGDAAAARGARVLGRVAGFAAGYDPRPEVDENRGTTALTAVVARAIADAGLAPGDIGAVVSSASGSRTLDAREASALRASVGPAVPVTAIKGGVGEALGASGALQVVTALESLTSGTLPGIAGLDGQDPGIELDLVRPGTRPCPGAPVLVTAVAAEGNCCALVVTRS